MLPAAGVAALLLAASTPAATTAERALPLVSVDVPEDPVAEGTPVRVVVRLDRSATRDVEVRLDTRSGTAEGRRDYQPVHTVVTVPAGHTRLVVPIEAAADGLDEAEEGFTVRLSRPRHADLGDRDRAEVRVHDVDPAPRVLPQDAMVSEPSFGNRLGFTEVRLARPSGRRVLVRLATRSGSATAGSDFVPLQPIAVFAPGQTSQLVSVELLADDSVEPPETVRLVVRSARHARPGGNAVITILDSTG